MPVAGSGNGARIFISPPLNLMTFVRILQTSLATSAVTAAPILEVDFSHLAAGTAISDGDRMEDVSGLGHHGFWGDASGSYPLVNTPTGTGLDTTLTSQGHLILRDGLTEIPDTWDGPTTSITPYFSLVGTSSYTFEAVINWNLATSSSNGLLGQTGGAEFWLRESGGDLHYVFDDDTDRLSVTDTSIDISAAKADGQWHAIAVVYDATAKEIRSYLDGTLIHTLSDPLIGSLGAMTSGTGDFRVGAYNTADASAFNGIQDHYRISDTALAPAAFLQVTSHTGDAPVASNVAISGIATEGELLTGSYTYSDTEGDLEGPSTFQWYRSLDDVLDAGDTAISGATSTDYTLQTLDVGTHVLFQVRPVALTGNPNGLPAISSPTDSIALANPGTPNPGPFQRSDPFISGTGGYHTYRIPAVLKAADGTILAFCEGRKTSSSDAGDIDTVLRRSTDDGLTWGPMILVQEEGGTASITIGNPVPILDESNGRIHLLFCRNNDRVFHTFSDDHGLTWSTRTEITDDVKDPAWGWHATGPCHGIQLKRGTQAGRLVAPCDYQKGSIWGDHVVYSDDGGVSWQIGASDDGSGGVNPNENSCVELVTPAGDGGSQIYFNSRDQGGSAAGTRAEAWSDDGGLTYDPADFANNTHFLTPVVQGSTLRFRATDEGDSSNSILFSCPNAGSRSNMSIWQSTNETVSWSDPVSIFSGPSAYSDMVRLADDRAGVLFENGDGGAYERISFYRVSESHINNPPPVAEPKSALWLFEEKDAGQGVDVTPGAILDSHPDANALHLDPLSATLVYAGGTDARTTALDFDGSGGLKSDDTSNNSGFDYTQSDSVTFEASFKVPSDASLPGAILAKNQQPGAEWWIRVQSNGTVTFLWDDSTGEDIASTTTAVNDGEWHHLACVRDTVAGELRVYLDGVLEDTETDNTTGNVANGIPLTVGGFNGTSGRDLTGSIDWVAITTGVLAPGSFVGDRLTADTDLDGIPDTQETALVGNLDDLGEGDHDGDLSDDLLEIALDSDPTSSSDMPYIESMGPADPNRVFAYTRRSDLPWLNYDEQFSSDLSSWSPLAPPMTRSASPLGPSLEEIIFESFDLPGTLFFRVDVTADFP